MGIFVTLLVVIGAVIAIAVLFSGSDGKDPAAIVWGEVNGAMHCPHCSAVGQVRTKQVVQKKGVSGAKATAALLTGGTSMLATGLSRKEQSTQAHCSACRNTWTF